VVPTKKQEKDRAGEFKPPKKRRKEGAVAGGLENLEKQRKKKFKEHAQAETETLKGGGENRKRKK